MHASLTFFGLFFDASCATWGRIVFLRSSRPSSKLGCTRGRHEDGGSRRDPMGHVDQIVRPPLPVLLLFPEQRIVRAAERAIKGLILLPLE